MCQKEEWNLNSKTDRTLHQGAVTLNVIKEPHGGRLECISMLPWSSEPSWFFPLRYISALKEKKISQESIFES